MTAVSQPPARTTDARTAEPRFRRWSIAIAQRLQRLTERQLVAMIWLSSLAMCMFLLGSSRTSITGTMNIVENWGAVERVALWQDFLAPVIPRYTLPTGVIAWGFRAAMLTAFLAQAGAFLVVMRSPNPSLGRWLIGPIGAHIIMTLLMVPSNSDVFFYEAVGDLAARGHNPYVHELMEFPDHPLIPWNYWIDIGTVYGPLWVQYNRIVMMIAGPDPVLATLLQKLLAGLVTFALVGLVYWFAKRLVGRQSLATAAAVIVAWQPNMIIETSGQVHNDPHTVLLATIGLVFVILGGIAGIRAAIILVTLSIMIKFITIPLLGVPAIVRIVDRNRPHPIRHMLGKWLLDGVAIVAVVLAAFLPFWEGYETIEEMLAEPGRLYTHPIWRLIQSVMGFLLPADASDVWNAISRPFLQVTTMALFIGIVVFMGVRLWNDGETAASAPEEPTRSQVLPWWTRHVLYGWMIMFFVLAYVPVNSHPWYWVWPVAAVGLVIAFDFRSRNESWSVALLPTWFWIYLWGNALLTLMYHTRIARY
jgi:hypothetical protein